MANIIDGSTPTSIASVNAQSLAMHTSLVGRGHPFRLTVNCGLQAAAVLAAGAKVLSMRLNPSTAFRASFSNIRVTTVVSTVFTTAPSAVRKLGTCVVNGAAPTGGTAIAAPVNSRIGGVASQFASASGGDIRFTNAIAGLTGGPATPASTAGFHAFHTLFNGAVGTVLTTDLVLDEWQNPIVVNPGDVISIANATDGTAGAGSALAAFDAGGIIGITVELFWCESALLI